MSVKKMNKKQWAMTGFLIWFAFGFFGMVSAGWLSAIPNRTVQAASALAAVNGCLAIIVAIHCLRKATTK
jgi:hypothetical protein